MNSTGQWSLGSGSGGHEPGTRRRQLAGYWKAAKELKHQYEQSYMKGWAQDGSEERGRDLTESFGDGAIARSGEAEMAIFPSYARRHVKRKPKAPRPAAQHKYDSDSPAQGSTGSDDADSHRRDWDRYERDHAIVDVDVRGWVYIPHTGPYNRRTRAFLTLVRRMAGITPPAGERLTESTTNSRSPSPARIRDGVSEKKDEEAIAKGAESIIKRGEKEAELAGQGLYSEPPGKDSDSFSTFSVESRVESPTVNSDNLSLFSMRSNVEHHNQSQQLEPTLLKKRESWNRPGQMSQEELAKANTHLLHRIKPFLANPLGGIAVSAFFFNNERAIQKTVTSDAYGHFTFRAALEFLPTHVRVFVPENLSVTEEVKITEPHGISIISDIDDTVKHSAISSGSIEIFRNIFIRDFGELSVPGVKEWYERLAQIGVQFHYVSNSPWQLYPSLTEFFALAKLPPGSFHLKQYSGMLQGIFEPVAERKKGTLERILRDFPERQFILVGDSGEADLEVYTDLVQENPGRVLAIFIRDVTTSHKQRFFDSSSSLTGDNHSLKSQRSEPDLHSNRRNAFSLTNEEGDDPDFRAAIEASLKDFHGNDSNGSNGERPPLPPRRKTDPNPEEDLIDLHSDIEVVQPAKVKPPTPPAKPKNLSHIGTSKSPSAATTEKPRPQIPRKPSSAVQIDGSPSENTAQATTSKPPRPDPPQRSDSELDHMPSLENDDKKRAPPLPFRKPLTYSAVAAQYASSLIKSARDTGAAALPTMLLPDTHLVSSPTHTGSGTGNLPLRHSATQPLSSSYGGAATTININKKEEMWRRRWTRAKHILEEKGVMLQSWRVGSDVEDACIQLVERTLRESWKFVENKKEKVGEREGNLVQL